MKKGSSKKGKGQKGFTLIELLVVVGILAALAAILVPNVARFVGTGREEGADAEQDSVQASMDAAIAELGLTAVEAAPGAGISDFSSAGAGDIDPSAATVYLFPDYLRFQNAHYGPYIWDATGLVARP